MRTRMPAFLGFLLFLSASIASATTVRFSTSLGTFDVNLYDELTPETVNNFLSYVDAEAYDNTIVHRGVTEFIIQGGGFNYDGELPLTEVTAGAAVENEPFYSNLRGTIAMAKRSGNVNSATNQWFINLGNNSENLDIQNGGFTVFGEVMLDDMDVVDAIAALPKFNFTGALTDLPLRNYSDDDYSSDVKPNGDNFVLISSVTVVDPATDTLGGAEPVPNTLLPAQPSNPDSGGNSGGGSWGWPSTLAALALFIVARVRRKSALTS